MRTFDLFVPDDHAAARDGSVRSRAPIWAVVASAVVSSALLTGCGDNGGGLGASGAPDAAVDASPAPVTRAVVAAGDFNPGHPGVLSTLDVASRQMQTNIGPAQSIGDDPVVRRIGDELAIINRADGNNITIVDAHSFQLVEQLGTGAGSNPQDVAMIGNKLYVAAFGGKGVLELTRGSTSIVEIDLSVDDPDGKPNCNSIYLAGDQLYVACELLDDTQQYLPPRGPGRIYVVDPGNRAITRSFALANVNPFGVLEQLPAFSPHPGDLVIPTVSWLDGSGCVERITTGPNAGSAGCVIDNAQLGGYASRIEVQAIPGAVMMWMAVPASDFQHSYLRGYDLTAGSLWNQPLNPAEQIIGDIAACPTGELVVSDTAMDGAGLRVYRGALELTSTALPIGLRPLSAHGLVCN